MIGLANLGDDPVQTPRARPLLAARCAVDDPGYATSLPDFMAVERVAAAREVVVI
jgi:hypothetical protein